MIMLPVNLVYLLFIFFFFFNDTATTEIYTLSLHDALPILLSPGGQILDANPEGANLLGGADATALRGRVLTEWAPAAQRGMLAAGLRHAVTKRQDVALSFEFAGEPAREVRAVVVNVDPVRAA